MRMDGAVHIVDDDAPVRRSLERLLQVAGLKTVAHETARAFLEAAPRLSAGCILLDIRMPEIDGLEVQDRLNELGCCLPLIAMTGHGDVRTAVRAMKAGAVDFLEKPLDDEDLLGAIEKALAQAPRAARERAAAEAAERIARLSPREREVLDGLVAGRTNKAIADDLGISVRTVEVHRVRMLARLHTRHLADAIRLAVISTVGSPVV
jgi:two-component system, LuxR family, response regulator FixJ